MLNHSWDDDLAVARIPSHSGKDIDLLITLLWLENIDALSTFELTFIYKNYCFDVKIDQ